MSVLHSVISLSLIVSPFILLLLLTVPLTDKRYNPGGRCFIWLLLMVAMCVPLITVIPKPAFQINMPVAVIGKPVVSVGGNSAVDTLQDNKTVDGYLTEASIVPESINQMILPDTMVSVTGNAPDNKNIAAILEAIAAHLPMLLYVLWLSGALVFLSLRLGSYFILRRSIRRWSTHVTDEYILKMFDEIRASLLVHGSPSLLFCKKIASPMLMGYIKPLVLLPAVEYQPDELALLLRHELAHYKRRDLWFKLALVVVTSVYWFNPLVHLMAAQAGKDLEAACDDLTVNGMDILLRKRYSEIILNAACKPQLHPHPMTTHFFGGKYMLKKRFANILGTNKKKGTALFAVMGAVVFAVTLMVGFDFAEAKTLPDSTLPKFSTVIAGDETVLSIDDFSNLDTSTILTLFQLLVGDANMLDEEEGNLDFSSIRLEGKEIDIMAIDIYFASEEEYRLSKQNKNKEKEFISRMADVFHLDSDCISIIPDAKESKTVVTYKFKAEDELRVYDIERYSFMLENLPHTHIRRIQ